MLLKVRLRGSTAAQTGTNAVTASMAVVRQAGTGGSRNGNNTLRSVNVSYGPDI
jgi:hypothetical protein